MKIKLLFYFFADNSPSPALLIPATVLHIQDEPLDLSVRSRKRHREEQTPGSGKNNIKLKFRLISPEVYQYKRFIRPIDISKSL